MATATATPSIPQMVNDPDFMKLAPQDQQAALAQFDPEAGQLSPDDFAASVKHLQQQALARPDLAAPPAAAGGPAGQPMQPVTTDTMHIFGQPIYDEQSTGPVAGVVRAAKNIERVPGAVYHAIQDAPRTQEEQDLYTAGHPFGHDYGDVMSKAALAEKRLVTDQMVDAYNRGRKLEDLATDEKDPVRKKALQDAASTYTQASFLPILGPTAANMTERALAGNLEDKNSTPDPWGALTEGITYALVPKVGEASTELIGKGLGAAGDLIKGGVKAGVNTASTAAGKAALDTAVAVGKAAHPVAGAVAQHIIAPAAKGIIDGLRQAVADPISQINEAAAAPAEVDAHPIKMSYDPEGNTIDLDGRHRVMQAVQAGQKTIPVEVTMRDGSVQTMNVNPQVVADKFGVTPESLAETDAQQAAVRAGGGAARPAQMVDNTAATKLQVAKALTQLQQKAVDYLAQNGISKAEALSAVKAAVGRVQDEYTYWTNRPPTVSGGSFDADESFAKNLNETLKVGPPAEGVSAPGGIGDNAGKFNTRLAELAHTDPAFEDLQKSLTKGQTFGGGVAKAEAVMRRIPGTGPDVFQNNANESLTNSLKQAITKAANDDTMGYHLKNIMQTAQDNVLKTGNVNLRAVVEQINDGLKANRETATPSKFINFNKGVQVGDDTARATLIRDAFKEADQSFRRTASFGGPISAGAALGLGGFIASAGSPLGALGGMVAGIGADALIKFLTRHAFLDPALPGDTLFAKVMKAIPAEEPTGTLEARAVKNAAKGGSIQTTKVWKSLTPEQKAQVMRTANRVYSQTKQWAAQTASKAPAAAGTTSTTTPSSGEKQ